MWIEFNPRLWQLAGDRLPDGRFVNLGEPLEIDDELWDQIKDQRVTTGGRVARSFVQLGEKPKRTDDEILAVSEIDLHSAGRDQLVSIARRVGSRVSGTKDQILDGILTRVGAEQRRAAEDDDAE